MNALCLAALLSCQDPLPAPAAAAHDVVVLTNGDELQGRITVEGGGYLELELEPGATVGFALAQVAEIRRGAVPVPAAAAAVAPRGEWFVLHDATGQPVGWLATSVTVRADGGFAVNEEYEFRDGTRRYQVTALALAGAGGAPHSTYFRERVTEPVLALTDFGFADAAGQHERIVDERIVEASRHGDRLVVQRLDRAGRRERALPFPPGASFPLLARTLARESGTAVPPATLFDPATEELVVRAYDAARQRTVVVDGRPVQVTEVAETSATGRNAVWIDASARTVRRELAGPALVALPSSASLARGTTGGAIAPAIVASADGAFGVWVPNPAWTAREGLPAGQVQLACDAHGASVSLSRLDHLEAGTPLDVAADAVASWFRLLQPELTIDGREPGRVRERPTVHLRAHGARGRVPLRAAVDVIPHGGAFLVLVCIAPARAWDELAPDFAFLRRAIELEPQSLAPTLQGPLAEPARGPRGAAARANG